MRALLIFGLVSGALVCCGGRVDSPELEGGATVDASSACPASSESFGWFLGGANAPLYQGGNDEAVSCNGAASVFVRSGQASSSDFGTMMTTEDAAPYAGKRLRFRGWVKSDSLDAWAGLWMRVDEPGQKTGAFDNMANRPVQGTTPWTQYDVVLDVAADAVDLAFGVLLAGNGTVWLDGVDVAIVDDSVPTTGQ